MRAGLRNNEFCLRGLIYIIYKYTDRPDYITCSRPSICPESSGTVPNLYLYICPVTDTPKSLDCPGNSPNEVAREK